MQDLIKQEIFELAVLEKLKNNRILEPLVFVGSNTWFYFRTRS
jgi:hypothetical protein